MRTDGGRRASRGIALPLVLLLLLALTGLAHGALLLATAKDVASRGLGAWVEARVADEAARRRLLRVLLGDTLPALSVGVPRLAEPHAPGGPGPFHLVRLGPELHLLASPRAARALSALDPAARLVASPAVVERGGRLVGGGVIDLSESRVVRAGEASCAALLARTDSLLGRPWLPVPSRPLAGPDSASGPPALGALVPDSLLARLAPVAPGTVTPGPGETCRADDPANWGAPSDLLGPCGRRQAAVAVSGDLTVVGGEGQGVLVVAGTLRLLEGARFHGLVVVGGDLLLDGGAGLEGAARVRGDVDVRSGARVVGRACPVLLGLAAAGPLRRPVVLPEPLPLDP